MTIGTVWFCIIAAMLTIYVVLDGFDLGVGVIHKMVAKTDAERRTVIQAIGPVWDGNEVWLIAVGGCLFLAFPAVYASSFSGFYLPLMMVLWLLILRGIGIEFRSHLAHPLWLQLWETVFSWASILLAIFFGVALGNVIRGVPLGPDGYFFEPLWTNFRTLTDNGILDWYTVFCGIVALCVLALHGALYLMLKTRGEINRRSARLARVLWPVVVLFTAAAFPLTMRVQPGILNNYRSHPGALAVPALALLGLLGMRFFLSRRNELCAFLSSAVYIAGMLAGAALGLFPTLLPASTQSDRSLNVDNSAAGAYALHAALVWWIVGILIAITYFVFIYRKFARKVEDDGFYH